MSDVTTNTLTLAAPAGAAFEFETVKLATGESFEVPILTWGDLDSAVAYYGQSSILDILDGTSLRVSFQGIARRSAVAGKTTDDIAKAQIEFRPGKRSTAAATPAGKLARTAKAIGEKDPSRVAAAQALLEKIATGELSDDDIAALLA